MKAILDIFRRLLSFILYLILFVLLLISPLLISISELVTNRETIPMWLEKSGIYNQASSLATQKIKESIKEEGISLKNISVKDIEKKIKSAITPSYVKTNIYAIATGVYNWLEGKEDSIDIQTQGLNLSKTLSSVLPKNILENSGISRFIDLVKPCTKAQNEKYVLQGGFTSVNDLCLPENLSIINVEDGQDNGINNKVISLDNIFQIPPIDKEFSNDILLGFKVASFLPTILIGLIISLSILYLLLEPSSVFKYYSLGITAFILGVINLILFKSSILLNQLLMVLDKTVFKNIPPEFKLIDIKEVINYIYNDIAVIASKYAIFIVIFGIIVILIPSLLRLIKK